MDEDADLVAMVAADYLRRRGAAAIPRLREREEIAYACGDRLSAETWHEIAEMASLMLRYSD